jgi:Helicase conserved C-terminal domain
VLSAYAEHTADRVWSVSTASLLGAISTGRDLQEFTTFLTQRTEHALPDSLATLISDVTRRTGQLTDLRHARVIECADPALATLIARDRALRTLCYPIRRASSRRPAGGGTEVPHGPAQARLCAAGAAHAVVRGGGWGKPRLV